MSRDLRGLNKVQKGDLYQTHANKGLGTLWYNAHEHQSDPVQGTALRVRILPML